MTKFVAFSATAYSLGIRGDGAAVSTESFSRERILHDSAVEGFERLDPCFGQRVLPHALEKCLDRSIYSADLIIYPVNSQVVTHFSVIRNIQGTKFAIVGKHMIEVPLLVVDSTSPFIQIASSRSNESFCIYCARPAQNLALRMACWSSV